ncbi:hypothetical protein Pan216_23480 [Planctomycetes bacterium Pan216]|uniref:GH141-like insertion domain-containing protein n=1 Tax=Kolteria novifilia TaxID=2527975 RepID=A0A518B3C4_9BACT|nr:hypothetical protein Pan216_23480 [Planctomycetes bacterium Pan216]
MRPMLATLLLTTILAAPPAAATEFFVSPNGNDSQPGTKEKPFATIGRAKQAVRDTLGTSTNDLRVVLRGGTYSIAEPLRFAPEDGGDAKRSVSYEAFPGETPIISGGRRIAGWTVNEDGSWSVQLPEVASGKWTFRELFVDHQRSERARYPDTGYLRVEKVGPDKRTSFTYSSGDVKPVADVSNVELVFFHDWSISRIPLSGIDETTRTVTTAHPVGPLAKHYQMDNYEPNPRYYLENAIDYLDAPGEWFLDQATGVLTYRPREGESPTDTEVIAPVAEELLLVQGTDEKPVTNLHFRGLNLRHCAWNLPEGGYAAGQAGYHERRGKKPASGLREPIPAAVLFEVTDRCSFEDGRIEQLGTSGIRFGSRCRDNRLVGTVLSSVAGNGVLIGEDSTRRIDRKTWWRVAPEQAAAGNEVTNCVIERCERTFSGAVGIWIGIARDTKVTHNVLRELPYTGVSVGWMWNPTPTPCGANRVADNHIHDIMQVLSDGGGIYTLGLQPGTTLSGNLIHGVSVNKGRAESNGMFLDEGSTDLVIGGNVIYDIARSPLRFHKAGENLVKGNLLVVGPDVPPVRYNRTPEENVKLEDNTIEKSEAFKPEEAQRFVPNAGLEEPYRTKLLGE